MDLVSWPFHQLALDNRLISFKSVVVEEDKVLSDSHLFFLNKQIRLGLIHSNRRSVIPLSRASFLVSKLNLDHSVDKRVATGIWIHFRQRDPVAHIALQEFYLLGLNMTLLVLA